MPRMARRQLVTKGSINHAVWQTHNLEAFFDAPGARQKFYELLLKYKAEHRVRIHSYVLMGTHPHVVCLSEKGQEDFSMFWKKVNQAFAKWFNKQTKRRGQVVMERLESPRIQDERHALAVMRYVDRNPVQAKLVKTPKDWRYSSHRHYAYGEADPLVDDAPAYLALGDHPLKRRRAYLHLFAEPLEVKEEAADAAYVKKPFIGEKEWAERMKKAAAAARAAPRPP
ncbi:MAG: transposase [Anaeromyxobacteraceae bacterium]